MQAHVEERLERDRPVVPRPSPRVRHALPKPLQAYRTGERIELCRSTRFGDNFVATVDRRTERSLIHGCMVTDRGYHMKEAPFGYTGRTFYLNFDGQPVAGPLRELAVPTPRWTGLPGRLLMLEGPRDLAESALTLGRDLCGPREPDGDEVEILCRFHFGLFWRLGRMCIPRPCDVEPEFREARP